MFHESVETNMSTTTVIIRYFQKFQMVSEVLRISSSLYYLIMITIFLS